MKKKIGTYLAAREDLQARYMSLVDLVNPSIKGPMRNLLEFDLLNYSYVALKAYYEFSKSKWDLDYRNLLDELASVNSRIELKLPIYDLYDEVPGLFVLRRELKENAREAGKISHLLISSLATPEELASLVAAISGSSGTSNDETPIKSKSTKLPSPLKSSEQTASENAKDQHSCQSPGKDILSVKKDSYTEKIDIENSKPTIELSSNSELQTPLAASGKPANNDNSVSVRTTSILNLQIEPEALLTKHNQSKDSTPKISDKYPSVNKSLQAQMSPHEQHSVPLPLDTTELQPPDSNSSAKSEEKESTPSKSKKRSPSPDIDDFQTTKKIHSKSAILQLQTWSRSHIKCLTDAAFKDSENVTTAIQDAFKKKFHVSLTIEEAETLRLHYGLKRSEMENYRYNMQVFHLVATKFYGNMAKYVVIPWEEIRLQYSRKTGTNIPDWEVRGRYYLFLLHRSTYGRFGEPCSNYCDLVASFHKVKNPDMKLGLPVPQDIFVKSINSPARRPIVLTPTLKTLVVGLGLSFEPKSTMTWSPQDIEGLVEAELCIPLNITNRSCVLMQYIRRKTGKVFDVAEVDKCRNLIEVRNLVSSKLKSASAAKRSSANNHSSSIPNSKSELAKRRPIDPSGLPNQFDILLKDIAESTKDDNYYSQRVSENIISEFWDLEKSKSIISTVEFISKIDPATKDVTQKVARLNMIKIVMLRLLREHQVKIQADLIETRLKRMMELDAFDDALCCLINEILN